LLLCVVLKFLWGGCDEWPVDTGIFGAGISKPGAGVQANGVVRRRPHVLKIDALFYSPVSVSSRSCSPGNKLCLTGIRCFDGNPSVFHCGPLLARRRRVALLEADSGHVLPVAYSQIINITRLQVDQQLKSTQDATYFGRQHPCKE
jgi:hypothetical protein